MGSAHGLTVCTEFGWVLQMVSTSVQSSKWVGSVHGLYSLGYSVDGFYMWSLLSTVLVGGFCMSFLLF